MSIEEGDIVGYTNLNKRRIFGDMIIVHLLPHDKVDVRRANSLNLRVWEESLNNLEIVETKRNGGAV